MPDFLSENSVIQNLATAEQFARMGMAIFFGISFFANAFALQWKNDNRPFVDTSIRIARAGYLIGTGISVSCFTLAFISPTKSVADLVVLGMALVLATTTLLLDRGPQGMPALTFLSAAFIWFFTVLPPFYTNKGDATVHSVSWLSGLHIATAVAGEALCVLAFCVSLLYLWDYHRLKTKHLQRWPPVPSLDTLDKLVGSISTLGLFLISTSLISGIALVFHGSSLQSVGSTKIIWAFTVWGWYMLALFGRGFWGWRGRRGAQLSLWGTLLLLCALFGTVWKLSE